MSVARRAQVCWAAKAWQRAARSRVLGLGEQVVDLVGEGRGGGEVDQVGAQGAQGGQVGGGDRASGGQVFQGFEREAGLG